MGHRLPQAQIRGIGQSRHQLRDPPMVVATDECDVVARSLEQLGDLVLIRARLQVEVGTVNEHLRLDCAGFGGTWGRDCFDRPNQWISRAAVACKALNGLKNDMQALERR